MAQIELTATHNIYSNTSENLQTILMIQNPTTLDETIGIVTNYELIASQIEARNKNVSRPQQTHQTPNYQQPFNIFRQPFKPPMPNFARPQQYTPFPSQPIAIQQRPFQNVQPHYPTNRQVFGPQKPQNAFQNVSQQFPKPTPMSGVSVQAKRPFVPPQQHQFNKRPKFVFKELTHMEDGSEPSTSSQELVYPENMYYYTENTECEQTEYYPEYVYQYQDETPSKTTETEDFHPNTQKQSQP